MTPDIRPGDSVRLREPVGPDEIGYVTEATTDRAIVRWPDDSHEGFSPSDLRLVAKDRDEREARRDYISRRHA